MNTLYFGDNLDPDKRAFRVLRKHVQDECVDLVYLDPPFNSKRDYNSDKRAFRVIFKEATGALPASQMTAFEDSWHWNDEAARAFDELASGPHSGLAELIQSFKKVLSKRNDVTAYLVMMGPAPHRAASRAQAHRLALPSLRPDRLALFEDAARCDLWRNEVSDRDHVEADERTQ